MSLRNKIGFSMVIGGLAALIIGAVLLTVHYQSDFGEIWMGGTFMVLAFVLILTSPLENTREKRERYPSEVKTSVPTTEN